jgi:hypothetical protein
VAEDGKTAFVALQEANAAAVLDIASATIKEIQPLGVKDHAEPGNGLDPSDRDNGINIRTAPVFGLYMPDFAPDSRPADWSASAGLRRPTKEGRAVRSR